MNIKNTVITTLVATFGGPLLAGSSAAPAISQEPTSVAGWTLDLEALSLRAFQGGNNFSDGDYDFAGRATLGYQFNKGWFTQVTYFGFNPGDRRENFNAYSDDLMSDAVFDERFNLKASYLDWVLGKNFNPTAGLALAPFAGLRWATLEQNFNKHVENLAGDVHKHHEHADYEGLGLVVGLDAVEALGNGFSLYGTAKASVIFGSSDYSRKESMIMSGMMPENDSVSSSDHQVAVITELGLGVQYDFSFSNITGNLRAGLEGQLWNGFDNSQSEMKLANNDKLAGFVLGARFRF